MNEDYHNLNAAEWKWKKDEYVNMYKRTEEYYVVNSCTVNNTPRAKMTGVVSSGHNGLGNARRSMFPTWNETAGMQVLIACTIPLTPFSVHDITKRKWRLRSRKRFVCCSLRIRLQPGCVPGDQGCTHRTLVGCVL
jgi:hypothetical protein